MLSGLARHAQIPAHRLDWGCVHHHSSLVSIERVPERFLWSRIAAALYGAACPSIHDCHAASFCSGAFFWPWTLRDALTFGLPPLLVRVGLWPAWTQLTDGEREDDTWKTRDDQEFHASVFGLAGPARISADWPGSAVAYRYRKTAPTTSELSRWCAMTRMSLDEWSQFIESEDELYEPRPFEANLKLDCGKYLSNDGEPCQQVICPQFSCCGRAGPKEPGSSVFRGGVFAPGVSKEHGKDLTRFSQAWDHVHSQGT